MPRQIGALIKYVVEGFLPVSALLAHGALREVYTI
jgi:hypothetical protein